MKKYALQACAYRATCRGLLGLFLHEHAVAFGLEIESAACRQRDIALANATCHDAAIEPLRIITCLYAVNSSSHLRRA